MAGLPSKTLSRAKNVSRKPDTKSRKMVNLIRYVTNQDPKKKAALSTAKPGK